VGRNQRRESGTEGLSVAGPGMCSPGREFKKLLNLSIQFDTNSLTGSDLGVVEGEVLRTGKSL